MTELIVAATLLLTGISLMVSVSFRTGKLWQDSRHHELALQELTNQLELITAREENDIRTILPTLEVSEEINTSLPNPKLTGRLIDDEFGKRVELAINWDRVGSPKPLTLIGWVVPAEEEP